MINGRMKDCFEFKRTPTGWALFSHHAKFNSKGAGQNPWLLSPYVMLNVEQEQQSRRIGLLFVVGDVIVVVAWQGDHFSEKSLLSPAALLSDSITNPCTFILSSSSSSFSLATSFLSGFIKHISTNQGSLCEQPVISTSKICFQNV